MKTEDLMRKSVEDFLIAAQVDQMKKLENLERHREAWNYIHAIAMEPTDYEFHRDDPTSPAYRRSIALLWRHLDGTQKTDFEKDLTFTCWRGPDAIQIKIHNTRNTLSWRRETLASPKHPIRCNCHRCHGLANVMRIDERVKRVYGLCIAPKGKYPAGDVALMHKLAFEVQTDRYLSTARPNSQPWSMVEKWCKDNPSWGVDQVNNYPGHIQWPMNWEYKM